MRPTDLPDVIARFGFDLSSLDFAMRADLNLPAQIAFEADAGADAAVTVALTATNKPSIVPRADFQSRWVRWRDIGKLRL